MNHRQAILVVLLLALVPLCTACVGPFNLTSKLNEWNNDIGDRWVNEIVFIVMVPVYGVCVLGDVLIFNAVEFWGGENPVHDPS